MLLFCADNLVGRYVCGSSETVDSIGPPSAKPTSVSHSGHEGGGGRGRGGGGEMREVDRSEEM